MIIIDAVLYVNTTNTNTKRGSEIQEAKGFIRL